MTCDDLPPLMEAWLDSELDTRGAADVASHLEQCARCDAVFAAARRGNEHISRFLRPPAEPADTMWQAIEKAVSEPARRPLTRHPITWAAALLAVLAAVVLTWRATPHPQEETSPSLVAALQRDHEEFLAGEFGPAFTGPPPAHVLAAAHGRVDAAAFAALPAGEGITIEGARLCHLDGVPVAWTLVRHHGSPVSWIAVRRGELANFPALRDALATGVPVVIEKSGPWHFAARSLGEYVICALGQTDAAALVALVALAR